MDLGFHLPRPQAAPSPILGPFGEFGADGIPLDIPQHAQQMFIPFDRKTLESALVYMPLPGSLVMSMPTLRVGLSEPTNERGKFTIFPGPDNQMPMIRHQAPAEQSRRRSSDRLEHYFFKREIIRFLAKQRLAAVGAVDYVID